MPLVSTGQLTLVPFSPEVAPGALPRPPRPDPSARTLAADLHDGVVQELFAARLDVDELLALNDLSPAARRQLERLAERLGESSRTLRAVLHRLYAAEDSATADDGAVLDRVRVLVEQCCRRSNLTADVCVLGKGADPTAPASELLVRAVREALANIVKHAGASQALVLLR